MEEVNIHPVDARSEDTGAAEAAACGRMKLHFNPHLKIFHVIDRTIDDVMNFTKHNGSYSL